MRVLFYGGCHAVALKRMFDTAAIGRHRFTAIQNFELIGSGTPFPYDSLRDYDAVAYSPIRNKGDWNTTLLQAKCDELGLRTVRYPWLQWNGYFPDVADAGHPPHKWTYQRLASMASNGATIEAMRAVAADPGSLDPPGYLDYAFRALSEHEGDLDFQIGGFVRRHFRDRRLFWTPDHPTLALYDHVVVQIARRLGIWINPFARHEEPHGDALLILPGVAHALSLAFTGDQYRLEGEQVGPLDLAQFLDLTARLFGGANQPVRETGAV